MTSKINPQEALMIYVLEQYSRSVVEDFNRGKLTPMSYSLHTYCKAVSNDMRSITRRRK